MTIAGWAVAGPIDNATKSLLVTVVSLFLWCPIRHLQIVIES